MTSSEAAMRSTRSNGRPLAANCKLGQPAATAAAATADSMQSVCSGTKSGLASSFKAHAQRQRRQRSATARCRRTSARWGGQRGQQQQTALNDKPSSAKAGQPAAALAAAAEVASTQQLGDLNACLAAPYAAFRQPQSQILPAADFVSAPVICGNRYATENKSRSFVQRKSAFGCSSTNKQKTGSSRRTSIEFVMKQAHVGQQQHAISFGR